MIDTESERQRDRDRDIYATHTHYTPSTLASSTNDWKIARRY